MSSHALRLYVAAVTLLVFFVLWAVIAARPWASVGRTEPDARLVALDRRQQRLEREARVVRRTLDRRWREYRLRLREREARIRTLERRHSAQVAAARAAAARLAGASGTYASPSTGGTASAPAAQVVTLPPQVKVVTLPPAAAPSTSSGSSHP